MPDARDSLSSPGDVMFALAIAERRGAEAMRVAIARGFGCTGAEGYGLQFTARGREFIAPSRCGDCRNCKTAAAILAMRWTPEPPRDGSVGYCTEPLPGLERRYCGLLRRHAGDHQESGRIPVTPMLGGPDA